MKKKLSLLLALAALLAFAVPSFASAATGLTQGGKLIATGPSILGLNVGKVTTTSPKTGNIECSTMRINGVLTVNSLTEVRAEEGVGNTSSCQAGATSVTVENIKMILFKTTGGGTGTVALSYSAIFPSMKCNYVTSGATFTYKPSETSEGGNLVTISSQALTVTPLACGKTAELDGVFSLSIVFGGGNIFLM